MIICFGDSLTRGLPGKSYLNYVRNKKNYKNMGLGSDTVMGMKRRLKRSLRRHKKATRYIIEIGVNDILHPYLKQYSSYWRMKMHRKSIMFGCIPCKDKYHFEREYDDMLRLLINSKKEFLIIGIPFIEFKESDLNQKAKEYNQIIKILCKKYSIPFIDLWRIEKNMISDHQGSRFFSKTQLSNLADTILSSLLPLSNLLSYMRRLTVTIDGVHLNEKTARRLAWEIDLRIKNPIS